MFEWKKFDKNNPPTTSTFCIVTSGNDVDICYCEFKEPYGYSWWNRNDQLFSMVTHYAVINLPQVIGTTEPV